MSLSTNKIASIKKVIKSFIDNNSFKDSEDHVQLSYTIEILKILNWNASDWKINTTQEVKTRKRPDILLKGNGGGTIFVIESKAPYESLDGTYPNLTFTEQLCNYIVAEGVAWGILTNFKEWRIYNAHVHATHKTPFKKLTLIDNNKNTSATDEQINEFFSLLQSETLKQARGKISSEPVYYPQQDEIKEEFFQNLTKWRNDLRNYLHKEYTNSTEEIDNQTQRILDRLIFIDVCYDKKIVHQHYLGAILFSQKNYYSQLKHKFKELDNKFNSEIFAKDICDTYSIPDEVLENIIRGIARIDFSLLSVHIIGEVYEKYLGELLKTTSKKITVIENKEHFKRKAQGIYYTPDYIVNYIVDNTVGNILDRCNSEKEIEKIKVLDPACGSGSFLIRTYDKFYEAYKRVGKKGQQELGYELNIRKKILLHNIYGVDLDAKAVEIAKLNLLLKAMENLNLESVTGRKILPNLSLNIRCGDSLVSGKYEDDSGQLSLFGSKSEYKEDIKNLILIKDKFYKEEDSEIKEGFIKEVHKYEYKINKYLNEGLSKYFNKQETIKPFNYDVAFCEVMKNGGFDCIIGNPPFVQLSGDARTTNTVKEYYIKTYKSSMGRLNTFGFFTKKGIDLLKNDMYLGFIVPNTISTQDYYEELRIYILDECNIKSIVAFDMLPFKDAVVENIIIVLQKCLSNVDRNKNNIEIYQCGENRYVKTNSIIQDTFNNTPKHSFNININLAGNKLSAKIEHNTFWLSDYMEINQAIALKKDRSKWISDKKVNKNYKPLLVGGTNINRYVTLWDGTYLNYDLDGIHSCKREDIFTSKEKIFFRRVGDKLIATLDTNKYYGLHTLVVMNLKDTKLNIKYFLALFNSNLMTYYYKSTFASTKKVFSEIGARQVKKLPIKIIDLKNPVQAKYYHTLIKLVDTMLDICKHQEKHQTEIEATDSEINDIVYKLYGLNHSEIKIIQDSLAK